MNLLIILQGVLNNVPGLYGSELGNFARQAFYFPTLIKEIVVV